MPEAKKPRFTPAVIALVGFIGLGIAFVVSTMPSQQLHRAGMTSAVSNGKQIGQALIVFDQDYGSFPDDKTAVILAETHPNARLSGNFSNDYFRQLLLSETADTEVIFFAKVGQSLRKPDNDVKGRNALESGENAWTYLMNADGSGLSTASNSKLPVLMLPLLYESGNQLKFDSKPFDGHAVIIRLNNSAETIAFKKGEHLRAADIYPRVTNPDGQETSSFYQTQILYPEGIDRN